MVNFPVESCDALPGLLAGGYELTMRGSFAIFMMLNVNPGLTTVVDAKQWQFCY
jgi:hypothetical protein